MTVERKAKLREVRRLIAEGESFEDFPDGVTWQDWEDAMALSEEGETDARRND